MSYSQFTPWTKCPMATITPEDQLPNLIFSGDEKSVNSIL